MVMKWKADGERLLKEKSLWGYPYPKWNLLIEFKFMILFKPLKTRPYSVGCVLTWLHNQLHHLWTFLSWTPFMYRVRDHNQTLWLTPRINLKVLALQQQLGLALWLQLLDYQLATPLKILSSEHTVWWKLGLGFLYFKCKALPT